MLAALLPWACAATCCAQPEPGKQYHFAIDAGSRADALRQFSKQTGLQVITEFDLAGSETQQLGPFVGQATADDAIAALLGNTDLSYKWQDELTITIFVKVVRPPRAEDNVQEVIVTNTRLPGELDTAAPVRVYRNATISRHGVSSVSEFTRYLTQQPNSLSEGYMQSGAQFMQMRGLGYDTTLVLINGRRVPPSANSIALNAVDLNNVPMAAVERIEVMSDSASAVYGADAVGGVINIILRDKIERPQMYLHYGQAAGGGEQRRAAVLIGTNNDRLQATLVLDYYETTALMGAERELWRNQDYRRYGGLDYRVSATNPGNVYSLTGQPLPGLSSSRAAVPLGTTGQLTPADFFATDGATNLASSFSNWSITPPSRRSTAYGSAKYSFAEDLQLFGEWLAESSELSTLRAPPSVSRQVVPAWNPFNPFRVAVAVDYSFADMPPISYLNDSDLLRIVGGVRGKFHRWDWEVSGINHGERGRTLTRGEIDRSLLASAVNSADPNVALNLFSVGPPAPPELLDSLIAPSQQLSFAFSTSQLSAFVRGPILDWVGRPPAELLIGAEWRHDAAGFFEGRHVDASRDISSVFSEFRMPLLDSMWLRIAARADDYGAAKWIVNPQYGLTWRPARQWLLRASYGTSFRPPSLFELYMPAYQPTFLVADPLRGGELSTVNLIVGGNRDLQAVTARSFSAGFVVTPDELPGLRVGGSYWRVAMDNRIIVPNYQELLKLDSAFPDHVVRDPANEQDVRARWPGRLRSMNLQLLNYGDLQTSGIDFETSLTIGPISASCVKLDLAVTWIDEYRSRDLNQMLPVDRVGIANLQGTIPEWRVVGSVAWKFGDYGVSSTATFVPSYQDADFWTGPLGRRIGSQTLIDLQAWIALGGIDLLEGSTLTLGARNLFDRQPAFANAGASAGYDMSQGTLTGRFLYVRLGKRF